MEKNKGQVLTEAQLSQIARRLFVTLDADNKLALTQEETIEFICFLKEHLYHEDFNYEAEKKAIDAMWDKLPKEEYTLETPNEYNPKYIEKK